MCSDGELMENYVCPYCGGTNVRKVGIDIFQCCADPYNSKTRSCGYLGQEYEFPKGEKGQRKL